jgi:16S rRNA (cytosine1402-N4)-methyltransferase
VDVSETKSRHIPVLFQPAIDLLRVRPGSTVVDCTLGLAGHASGIARMLGPKGHLIAFDRDMEAMALARQRLSDLAVELGDQAPRISFVEEAFSSIARHIEPGSVDAILADLGVSSLQLDQAHRGFSFMADGPLDMRMDTRSGLTASQVVNEASERELANLIYEYGEERRSRRIARAIVKGRPVLSTGQLARIITQAAPTMKGEKLHPATRSFMAIRLYLNRELDEVKSLVEAAPALLKTGGRLAVIAFHSLEDRIVKDSLRDGAHQGVWQLLTRKPTVADEEEIARNPRSRSAKLRVAEKLEEKPREPLTSTYFRKI